MMRKIFTTGQIAKLCRVAPRTVSKWIDSGRLRGYRIPGSNDRRVSRASMIDFLRANSMDECLEELTCDGSVLLVGASDEVVKAIRATERRVFVAGESFGAGLLYRTADPAFVWIDFMIGQAEARAMARQIQEDSGVPPVAGAVTEDFPPEDIPHLVGFTHIIRRPYSAENVVEIMEALLVPSGRHKLNLHSSRQRDLPKSLLDQNDSNSHHNSLDNNAAAC